MPLASVTFVHPVPVVGFQTMFSVLDSGGFRTESGGQKQIPQIFLDPHLRTVVIAGRHYPMERVVCFERAKMALTKLPEAPALANYTIGRVKP